MAAAPWCCSEAHSHREPIGARRELSRTGVEVVGSVPGSGIGKLPPLGEGTVVAVMDPNLTSAATVAERRGATVVKTLMPVGVDGTARFVQDVAEEAGSRTSEVVRARSVWEDLGVLRNRIRGRGSSSPATRGWRSRSPASSPTREPSCSRSARRGWTAGSSPPSCRLGPDVDVVVSPDYRGQTNRIDESGRTW